MVAERKHVGLTMPRRVKVGAVEAAGALEWSVGAWVLAAAAEYGPALREAIGVLPLKKRPPLEVPAFTALYLTSEEREELDDQAVACGLNRSAFVTAVCRLALGDHLDEVVASLRPPAS